MIRSLSSIQQPLFQAQAEVDRIAYTVAAQRDSVGTPSPSSIHQNDSFYNQQKINKNSSLTIQLTQDRNQLETMIQDIDHLISQLIAQKIDLQMQSMNYVRDKSNSEKGASLGRKLDVNG